MKKILFFSLLATAMLFAACGDSNDEVTPDGNEVSTQDQEMTTKDKDTNQADNPIVENNITPNEASDYIDGCIIDGFFEPDTLKVWFLSVSQEFDANLLAIYLTRRDHNGRFTGTHWLSSSEKGQKYTNYYGDTTFSGLVFLGHNPYHVSAMPINSINVTADKNFDSEHPAGASLNDIFTLEYASAWNLIQSNYNPDINIRQYGKFQTIPLSEFKPLSLPYYEVTLYFNKLPEKLGTYEFTITFNYGKDPISGREAKVAPAVVKAEFTEKDYVALPKH